MAQASSAPPAHVALRAHPRVFAALALTMVLSACSSEDGGSPNGEAAAATSAGQSAAGANAGAPPLQGTGGSAPSTGGTAGKGGHSPSGGVGGSGSTTAAGGGAGKGSAVGGAPSAGQGGLVGPPKPGPNGMSPYERECRGDTVMCEDVASLRCLGIRDDTTVFGYSCSNPCESDDDCADTASSGEARAACVDFVTQKHCLLVCLTEGSTKSCPEGMGCYVYPQSPIGYCLWQ